MAGQHPPELPTLFVDRSLGRLQLPALLRNTGLRLNTLAEIYGIPDDRAVPDPVWLARAGQEGCLVLMKDTRIRYRPAEHAAVVGAGVRAVCLVNGNLLAPAMADLVINHLAHIVEACRSPVRSSTPCPAAGCTRSRSDHGFALREPGGATPAVGPAA